MSKSKVSELKRKLRREKLQFINLKIKEIQPYIHEYLRKHGVEEVLITCKWIDLLNLIRKVLNFTQSGSARKTYIRLIMALTARGELPDIGWGKIDEIDHELEKASDKYKNTKSKKLREHFDCQYFYQTYEWRKLRYATILKYGKKCMCCGAESGVMHVDHIKPLRKYWELRLDPNNVQVLCEVCNHGKGNWDETDFRSS